MIKINFLSIPVRCIEKNYERVIEGELRCKALSKFLEKVGAEKCVWLAEDGSGVIVKLCYDPATNQIVGLVLPLSNTTGCPIILSFSATTADEIKAHMQKKRSTIVYLVMAQPLNERFPPFILQIFGTDNTFTAQDVMNRWKFTEKELAKFGITVAGVSSDGDTRLLSGMCQQMLNPSNQLSFVQDSIHIGTKLRNRILKPGIEMKMGCGKVSISHLKKLIKQCPKEISGLSMTDVSPEDRQNFSSYEKMVSVRTQTALAAYVPESDTTIKYLKLCNDITSSFMNPEICPTERITRIWRALFFLRIWRESIRSSKYHTLNKDFITSNAFKCIEVNARNLIELIRKLREKPEFFVPTLFQSQTCEKAFRQFRSMGTVNFTRINFSILDLLYMIRRVEALNEILHFKLYDKGVMFPKFEVNTKQTKIYSLPNEHEIMAALTQAKNSAIDDAKKFGMDFDDDVIENYQMPGRSGYGTETDYEDSDEETIANNYYSEEEFEHDLTDEESIIDNLEDKNSHFIEIETDNGSRKIIRKSSLVWLLSEKNSKLSNDRLKRVQQAKSDTYSLRKQPRQAKYTEQ